MPRRWLRLCASSLRALAGPVRCSPQVMANLGVAGQSLLGDRQRMAALVAGVAGLAVGVYGAREGARVGFRHLEKAQLAPNGPQPLTYVATHTFEP